MGYRAWASQYSSKNAIGYGEHGDDSGRKMSPFTWILMEKTNHAQKKHIDIFSGLMRRTPITTDN